jgi:Protein of unknown function (DUF3300)
VLANMAKNLNWTSQLGEAYHNQAMEVMAAVQALRAQAKADGNLKSGPQIKVVQQTPDTIVIEPANPQVVYVPTYNPAVIYGTPYVVPGYTAGDVAAAGVLGFGAGIAVGAAMADGGWGAWGCDWSGGAAVYNHNAFYGNSAWHGGYYNGYHGGYGYHDGYGGYGYHGSYSGYHGAYNSNFNRNVNTNLNRNFNSGVNRNSWAHNDSNWAKSNAFSGHSSDLGGWGSRSFSQRGWGSMRAGGFSGGHFGGGRFGGGGFHGGGFRR